MARRFSAGMVALCALLGACAGKHEAESDAAAEGSSGEDGSVSGADGGLDGSGPDGSGPEDDGGGSPTGDGGGSPGLPDGSPFVTNDAGQVLCGDAPCACADGEDDDDDGLIDLADPECVSSWDNDEGSLATGISGDNRDFACQDCFFDGNSGSGNDGCRLPSSCLLEGNASSGQGSCNSCEQTEQCKTFCQAYTPNGCDCFGCCSIRVEGVVKNLLLEAGCDIDGSDLDGCQECVPSTSCVNECGECELCPGKTVADLPASCFTQSDAGVPDGGSDDAGEPPPPAYTCDDGEQVCGADLPPCAPGAVCSFGCCILSPVLL